MDRHGLSLIHTTTYGDNRSKKGLSSVENELAKKADTDVIMVELVKKADTKLILEELGRKADTELIVESLATKADRDILLEHIDGIQAFLESEKLEMTAWMSHTRRHERSLEAHQELLEGYEVWIRKHGSAAA